MTTAKVNTSAKLIAQVMAIAALALSVQPASAQTMYRVVRMALTGSTPIAINSKGKILLWSSNGSYYVCSETSCRILPRVQDGTTHWEDFNDLGILVEGDHLKVVTRFLIAVPVTNNGINIAHDRSPVADG